MTVVVGAATAAYLVLGYPYGPVVLSLVVALVAAVLTGHRLVAWLVRPAVCWPPTRWPLARPVPWLVVGRRGRRESPGRCSCWPSPRWPGCAASARSATGGPSPSSAGAARARSGCASPSELHDVVAHHMSLINVQASVALHLRGTHPEQVDEALLVIKGASKEALVELRSLIEVLREGDGPAPRHPAASLAALDDLVERARYAGLDLTTPHDRDPDDRCRPASSSPPTGSCRRRSPTWCATPGADRAEVGSSTGPGRSSSASTTTVSGVRDVDALRGGQRHPGHARAGRRTGRRGARSHRSPLGGLRVVATFPTAEAAT